jgi:serine/threonine protein kinase
MQTPPLPQGDPNRPPGASPPASNAADGIPASPNAEGSSTIVRPPASRTDAASSPEDDALADLLRGDDDKVPDDAPTIISKNPPRPIPEEGITDSLRGRRLAHFELLEPIGVGGMAAVIRARDAQLDRSVALKVLPPEMAGDPENVRRFHQEARSAAKLDHENVARVFYCGEDQRLHFIAFEFVEGENLRALVERRGRLPVQEALHYMLQIATGLAHAAARGVVHRDIKPSNIIISPNGRAKLVDMGLARMEGPHSDKGLTQSGVTLGTFDYISPEQALEPRDADVRSDIYSLGCTFYHVLTGCAPVPEGTAAKKLHHHQHEAPIDPRQLNPEIPDDVAAILARMMAKNPKVRYQRAEHLVQHILLAAQRCGPEAGPKPDGVLFMDAPLPEPPRTRPLLVAGLTAMIVLIVILFFGRQNHPTETTQGFNSPSFAGDRAKDQTAQKPEPDPKGPRPDPVRPTERGTGDKPREVATTQELSALAQEARAEDAELDIILTGPLYEFPIADAKEGGSGLAINSRTVRIRAKDPQKKPILRFTYPMQQAGLLGSGMNLGWLGLFIDSDDVSIENVRFVLDGRGNRDGHMAGIVLRGRDKLGAGGKEFRVRGCEFIQAGQPPDLRSVRPASVVVDTSNRAARSRLTLEDCYLVGCEEVSGERLINVKLGGQDAVTLKSATDVVVTNCAFGPHYALFRIEPSAEGSKVTLGHCAGLLYGESAAFHLVGATNSCTLDLRQSWLEGLNGSQYFNGPLPWKGTVLLRQDGLSDAAVSFQGQDICFHRLDAFWVRPGTAELEVARDQMKFQEKTKSDLGPALPPNAKLCKESDPLALLERGEPGRAFQVNDALLQARTSDGKWLVGLTHWGDAIQFKPPAENKTAVAGRKVLIVDPDAKGDEPLAYKTLSGAIAETKANEEVEIQLRFNGAQAMAPVLVDKPIKVTIHPARDYHPIVTVQKSRDLNSYLFRVLDGDVTLEDLEFRLQAEDAKSQTVADLVGDGKCTFRKCVVTLEPAHPGSPIAVASISEPESMQMRMPTPQPATRGLRIAFENCLIRGEGDLIACHATRPFEVELNNVFAALSGSILTCDGSREEGAPTPEQPIVLRMTQVTAYVAGYALRVHAKSDFNSMPAVQVDSKDCVFQAAGGKSLVHLEGPDPGERINALLLWKAENNIYGLFENLMDNQPFDDKMPAPPIGPIEWPKRANESRPRFMKDAVLTLVRELPLTQVLPESFRVKTQVQAGQGAVGNTLARPYSATSSQNEGKGTE